MSLGPTATEPSTTSGAVGVPVLLFPGQRSEHADMLARARQEDAAVVGRVLGEASEVLGRDVAAQYDPSFGDPFPDNAAVQVGVFLVDAIHLAILRARGLEAGLSLGLSLGEYGHLLHIGALGFADLLWLVETRGRAYDAGPRGVMAAVFPLPLEVLEPVVARARAHGRVEISNYNAPTQHVLSGERAAVEAALIILSEECYIDGRILPGELPMHSSLFAPVADALRPHLVAAPWRAPSLPYVPNVLGRLLPSVGPGEIPELLRAQVCRPVQWQASLASIVERVPDAVLVEVGPGTVLSDMARRWLRRPVHHTADHAGWSALWAALDAGALRAA